jgi:ATP-dependent Clp protease adaptor protein ClpS
MSSTSTDVAIQPKTALKAPPMYKVIYVNDDVTSMQFVIDSLMDFFGYAISTAEKITNTVHTEGSACAAVLPFEIAEQKGIEITMEARKQGYPLQVKLEQEQ